MRKKSLKVTLFATLLATVGTLAYAEGENLVVTLKNGDAISWDSFVTAINTGKTDKTFEVTLPDTDPAKVAVANAKAAVTTAEGVVTEKETAVTTAEGVVTTKKALVAEDSKLYTDSVAAETAVGNAQEAIDNYVKNTIDPKRAAIATANSTIEANTKSISSLQTQQQNLQSDLAVATANRTTAKEAVDDAKAAINTQVTALNKELTALNSQLTVLKDTLTNQNTLLTNLTNILNSLPKKSGTVGWLKNMIADAEEFLTYVENYDAESTKTIFYRTQTFGTASKPKYRLILAFVATAPDDGNTWTPITPYKFIELTEESEESEDYVQYSALSIYLNNTTTKVITPFPGNEAYSIVESALGYLDNLSLSDSYQATTDEVQDDYKARETQLKNYIGTAADGDKPATGLMKRIADQQQLITAKEGEITAKEGEITAKEGELTNPTDGSDLAKAQADYNKYNEEITGANGYNAQLNSVKSQIEGLQNEVDDLNNKLDNPYEEKGETVPSLKTQLQNAIDGQATVDAALTAAQNQVKDANAAIAAARAEVTAAEKDVKDAQAALATAEADVVTKEAAVTTAENELKSAQTAANEAAAAAYFTANYQNINLNGDLTVESSITEPYSGTIWGNGYIITNKADGPIINNSFKGQLSDVAVNGTFAKSTAGATIDNVVVWTGSEGRVYNENGVATPYTTLAELGYAARSKYGINFGTDNLVTLTDNSKVFQFTVKNLDADVTNYVVINKDGKFMTGANTELPALTNVFAKSTTDDVKDLKLTNVYYGQNNTCYNVEITDGNNFYCPVEIQATNVNYNRQLKKGYNSVCLPFALDPSLLPSAVDAVCKYDRETTEKFWFTKVDGSVDANVPALLHTTEACSINLTGVVLAPTPASQLTTGGTFEGNAYESQSHGTFKRVNAGEFLGASQAGKIYGLQTLDNGDYVFKLAVSDGDEASQAHFPAFRMAISSQIVSTESQSLKAPSEYIGVRQIGIRDENGIEITQDFTTRVEDLVADVTSLNINGGIGEIIFASDADYGKVEIFSLDGKVVAIADVIEGKTSVNIQKGLYIVMGKKVLVK